MRTLRLGELNDWPQVAQPAGSAGAQALARSHPCSVQLPVVRRVLGLWLPSSAALAGQRTLRTVFSRAQNSARPLSGSHFPGTATLGFRGPGLLFPAPSPFRLLGISDRVSGF